MRYGADAARSLTLPHSQEAGQIKNIAVFVALTALAAKVYIPHEPVPFTLQTLFVVLAGAFLGWRNGTISMVFYLLVGAAGIPVFAGATAGLSPFFGPTAGYLFGFVLAAAIVGAIVDLNDSLLWTIFSMLAGFVVIFACGAFYLNTVFIHNWKISLAQGFLIFSLWDLIKLGAAVAVYRAFRSRFATRNA